VELARRLQLAPSTIGIHVDRLVRSGFLREGKRAPAATGRPPTILELNPAAGQFVGLDMDAKHIRAVSVDFAQRVLKDCSERIPANLPATKVIDQMITVIEKVKRRSRRLLGIGLAVPGTVDLRRGLALHYKFIRGWRDLPISQRMRDRYSVAVSLENNIRAMALAERWFGQGRDVNDFLCVGIRSGIGSGLVLRGELYRGPDGLAGEIGCWPCHDKNSRRTKTLEELASLPALLDNLSDRLRAKRKVPSRWKRVRPNWDQLRQALSEGDSLAQDVVAGAAGALGQAIASVGLALNPQRVIIAGPLAEFESAFLEPLRRSVGVWLPDHHRGVPEIVGSKLDAFVGALGAAGCAVQAWQPDSEADHSSLSHQES
ncbi:MAG: ROK family protein, partial [Pirellulales bacterium]|nr:ROK family protein [Pirellulales bacterium]